MASEDTHHEPSSESVLVPAPTGWPFVTSFGIALMFLGLVTHLVVSAVGIVLLARGLIGWWTDVLPVEKHEHAPLLPEHLRAATVKVARHSVEHLRAGEAGHRVKIPAEIHPYSAGIRGGVAGAAAMAIPAVAYGLIAKGSIWYPINLLAAAALPSMAAADDAQLKAFDATAFGVAVVSHLLISILVGLILLVTVFYFAVRRHDLHPHAERIKMVSWYWHFVDAVWIVVFTVVYVVGR
jgi:hypothetical protein